MQDPTLGSLWVIPGRHATPPSSPSSSLSFSSVPRVRATVKWDSTWPRSRRSHGGGGSDQQVVHRQTAKSSRRIRRNQEFCRSSYILGFLSSCRFSSLILKCRLSPISTNAASFQRRAHIGHGLPHWTSYCGDFRVSQLMDQGYARYVKVRLYEYVLIV